MISNNDSRVPPLAVQALRSQDPMIRRRALKNLSYFLTARAFFRFLLSYIIGGATMTAGQVSAFIVLDRPDQAYTGTSNATLSGYPAGITVAN